MKPLKIFVNDLIFQYFGVLIKREIEIGRGHQLASANERRKLEKIGFLDFR